MLGTIPSLPGSKRETPFFVSGRSRRAVREKDQKSYGLLEQNDRANVLPLYPSPDREIGWSAFSTHVTEDAKGDPQWEPNRRKA
jgi:hypothetical protein